MKLLKEEIKESQNFQALSKILTYHYKKQENLNPLITFFEFKELLENFIEEIMKDYLTRSGFDDFRGVVPICEVIQLKYSGSYQNHKIRLCEDDIKKLYNGDLVYLLSLSHELGHFKLETDIARGLINTTTIRYLKEQLIRKSSWDIKIGKDIFPSYYPSYYYEINYKYTTIETLANLEGGFFLTDFLKEISIDLNLLDQIVLSKLMCQSLFNSKNYLRNFDTDIRFNDRYLDCEKAFDYIIEDYPEWCHMPQLQIEYYLDKKGCVKKRTNEELLILQEETENDDIRKYIKTILNTKRDKYLFKDDDDKLKKLYVTKFRKQLPKKFQKLI